MFAIVERTETSRSEKKKKVAANYQEKGLDVPFKYVSKVERENVGTLVLEGKGTYWATREKVRIAQFLKKRHSIQKRPCVRGKKRSVKFLSEGSAAGKGDGLYE